MPLIIFTNADGLFKLQNELSGRDRNILKRQGEIGLKLAYFRKVAEQYPPPGTAHGKDPIDEAEKRNLQNGSNDEPSKKKRTFMTVIGSEITADKPGHKFGRTDTCGKIRVLFEETDEGAEGTSSKSAPPPNVD